MHDPFNPRTFEDREDRTPFADAALWLSIGLVGGLTIAIWAVLPLLKPGALV